MKKFSTLMIAALLSSGIATAKDFSQFKAYEIGPRPTMRVDLNKVERPASLLEQTKSLAAKRATKKTPSKVAEEYGPVIYDAPEGKVTVLNHSGYGYYVFYFYIMAGEYSYTPSEIVECDNGEVYLKNPLGQMITDSYIKGQKEGNKYVFDLPQAISVDQYNGQTGHYLLTNMQYFEDADGGFFYAANSEEAKELGLPEIEDKFVININDDGSLSYESADDGDTIIGTYSTLENSWSGYGDMTAEWVEFTDETVTAPDNIEPVEMAVTANGEGHFANVMIDNDNNEIYIQGIFAEAPEAWVKGSFDGSKATFLSGQYLGESAAYQCYTFFMAASVEKAYDEEYEEWYDVLNMKDSVEFEYDAANKTFTSAADNAIVFNASPERMYYINYLTSPVIKDQGTDISKQIANPSELSFEDTFNSYGYSYLTFKLSSFNTDGDLLDVNNIYYSVFVEGEEFIFYPDEYELFEEEMTMIPFNFTDGYDIEVSGSVRTVYFYIEGIENIGVKEYYIYKDGDEEIVTESDLVTVETNGVSNVADNKEIANVVFYNIAGQKVYNPEKGIYIKKVTYSDGTSSTFKVAKR